MSMPEGWYADPQRPGVGGAERWWNGASWTAHTRDLQADPSLRVRGPVTRPGDLAVLLGDAAFSAWDQVTRNPVPRQRTTADGELLAPPVVRGAAWLVDLVLVAALARLVRLLVLVVLLGVDLADGSAHWSTGDRPSWVGLLGAWLVAFGYHALFLRARGATPGKMLLGLVVRPVDAPGRLPWTVVLKRVLLSTVGRAADLVAVVPVVGGLSLLLRWWPVIDDATVLGTARQQTVHDLWAGTQVVQRPRGAVPVRRA